jgi:PadR family transcriptional regulator PadR
MTRSRDELLRGTLELLVLKVVGIGSQHGYGIARRIEELSDGVLLVEEGSLYPALHRLERKGWIRAEWGVSDANRRARYYELTAAGKRQLQVEVHRWARMSGAIERVMGTHGAET